MRKYLIYLLVLVGGSLIAKANARAQPSGATSGASLLPIHGGYPRTLEHPGLLVVNVVDSVTRRPLPDVALLCPDGELGLPTLRSQTLWLEQGMHRIQLFRSNYCSHWINDVRIARDSILWLTVPMGNPYVGVIKSFRQKTDIQCRYTDLQDVPAGLVEGVIRDSSSGSPVMGATIQVSGYRESVLSDKDGRFQFACRSFGSTWSLTIRQQNYGMLAVKLGRKAPHDTVEVDVYLSRVGTPRGSSPEHSTQKVFVVCANGWPGMIARTSLHRPKISVYSRRVAIGQSFGPLAGFRCPKMEILRYMYAKSDGTALVRCECTDALLFGDSSSRSKPSMVAIGCEPVVFWTNTRDAGWTYRVYLNCGEEPNIEQ